MVYTSAGPVAEKITSLNLMLAFITAVVGIAVAWCRRGVESIEAAGSANPALLVVFHVWKFAALAVLIHFTMGAIRPTSPLAALVRLAAFSMAIFWSAALIYGAYPFHKTLVVAEMPLAAALGAPHSYRCLLLWVLR